MRFKAQAAMLFFGIAVNGAVSVALAWQGFGVWSMILSPLLSKLIFIPVFIMVARQPLRLYLERAALEKLSGYGARMSVNNLVVYFNRRIDNIIVSRVLGVASLGLYNKALSLHFIPIEIIGDSVYHTVFRALASEQDNLSLSRYLYFRTITLVSAYTLPFYVGLWWLGAPFIEVVYGPHWIGAAAPLQILVLAGIFHCVSWPSQAVIAAQNRLGAELRIQIGYGIMLTAGCLASVNWGMRGIAWTVVVLMGYQAGRLYFLACHLLEAQAVHLFAALRPALLLNALLFATLARVHFALVEIQLQLHSVSYLLFMTFSGVLIYALGFLFLPIPALASEAQRWKSLIFRPRLDHKLLGTVMRHSVCSVNKRALCSLANFRGGISVPTIIVTIAAVAALFTVLLVAKSLLDFTMTGPSIRSEILANFTGYVAYAVARLALWVWVIAFLLCGVGALIYASLCVLAGWRLRLWVVALAAGAGLGAISAVIFFHQLLYVPSSLAASSLYDLTRFYPIWEQLTPPRLLVFDAVLGGGIALLVAAAGHRLLRQDRQGLAAGLAATWAGLIALVTWATWDPRRLTPFIDQFAAEGTFFANAYVPRARTAPSLTSLFTGTWPHTHGIRDNYISAQAAHLPVPGLPALLAEAGYHTVNLGDWAASDIGKLSLGFQDVRGASDQWNLKYLMRQGPKDMRLFLTLYTHNRFGRLMLPELFYLAVLPLTGQVARQTATTLNELAIRKQPFLLNVFVASTHAPFGSDYPYYALYSPHNYRGPAKFVVDGLQDPSAIIKRQGQDASAFDVQQIIDLYDGAVRQFDDAVAYIIGHLRAQGLDRNTIVVIYSAHGTDLFERRTWGQGNTVIGNDPSARIPLLIVDPRRPGGTVIQLTVRSVDIAPTLLALLTQPKPAAMEGVSLQPYLDAAHADLHLTAFHETGIWLGKIVGFDKNHLSYPSVLEMLEIPDKASGTLAIKPPFEQQIIQAKDRMVRTDHWKLIYLPMKDDAVYWLVDMVADPNGETNVIDRHPDVAAQLRQQLGDWFAADKGYTWNGRYLIPGHDR